MPRISTDQEQEMARRSGGIVIDSEALFAWIDQNLSPEEVFEDETLAAWADNNGYKKDE